MSEAKITNLTAENATLRAQLASTRPMTEAEKVWRGGPGGGPMRYEVTITRSRASERRLSEAIDRFGATELRRFSLAPHDGASIFVLVELDEAHAPAFRNALGRRDYMELAMAARVNSTNVDGADVQRSTDRMAILAEDAARDAAEARVKP